MALYENAGSYFPNLTVFAGTATISGSTQGPGPNPVVSNTFRPGDLTLNGNTFGLVRNASGSYSQWLDRLYPAGTDLYWHAELEVSGANNNPNAMDGWYVQLRGVGSGINPFLSGTITTTSASFDIMSGSTIGAATNLVQADPLNQQVKVRMILIFNDTTMAV